MLGISKTSVESKGEKRCIGLIPRRSEKTDRERIAGMSRVLGFQRRRVVSPINPVPGRKGIRVEVV
jgi:hypothetical protein